MNQTDLPGAAGQPGSDASPSFAADSHNSSRSSSSGGASASSGASGASGASSGGGDQSSGFGAGLDTASRKGKKKTRRAPAASKKGAASEKGAARAKSSAKSSATGSAKSSAKDDQDGGRGGRKRSSSSRGRGRGKARSSSEQGKGEDSAGKTGEERQSERSTRSGGSARKRRSSGRGRGGAADKTASGDEAPARGRRRSGARRADEQKGRKDGEEASGKQAETQSEGEARGSADKQTRPAGRRRRGSRGGRGRAVKGERAALADAIPGEVDDLPELPDLPDEAELVEDKGGGRGSRSGRRQQASRKKTTKKTAKKATKKTAKKATKKVAKKTGRKTATKRPAQAEKEVVRDSTILVNVANDEEQRVAVASGGRITDFMMSVESQKSLVNDVYRGKVVNLEPAIGAAFVDFGQGRNGFLHTSDVLSIYGEKGFTVSKLLTAAVDPEEWDESSSQPSVGEEMSGAEGEQQQKKKSGQGGRSGRGNRGAPRRSRPRHPIESLLKVGQSVAVQVTKESIGDKGPTLTTYISIPGRFLVLMPSMARVGISRKIEDEKERKRLKKILDSLNVPEGMGIIVRTAGTKKTKEEIKRDLDYLLGVWTNFSKRLPLGRGPMPLYQESDMAICTMRDLFGPTTEKVVVDDEKTHEQVLDFTRRLMPEHEDRIQLHDGDRPIFHHHGLEQEFEKIFSRRIELPSGGSIVFDQAEALVAIDVNSGRTRSSKNDFEETALMTNLEAVPEIARQIRLRDLGGILVIDFIDMMRPASNRSVEKAFRDALASDRARSRVGRISQFGLLELTRQRLGPGMNKKLFTNCPRCRGQGRVRTVESRSAALLRRLGSALTLKGFSSVEVRAHPDTIEYVKKHRMERLRELEKRHEREIRFTAVEDQLDDSVLRYMRSDGREVRPGGRRKR
ncbi:MAG: Rne/Rng family ribonuclease [Planctomycetota bacterium]|nr:Rne/Rng family ribonuclease [Planctomycetota bacterium]